MVPWRRIPTHHVLINFLKSELQSTFVGSNIPNNMKNASLKSLLVLSAFLSWGTLQAQTPPLPEIPRFRLSATAVGLDNTPELYWLDLKIDAYGVETRDPKRLSISEGSRGSTVEIPIRKPIQLFRKVQTPEGGTSYAPVIDVPEQEEGEQLLLLMYRKADGSGTMQFINDSAEVHPAGTVRFINLSSGKAVAAIGGQAQIIEAGNSKLLGAPQLDQKNRFPFDVAAKIPGTSNYRDPTKLLRFRSPDHRLLVLFTFLPKYVVPESSNPEVTLAPVLTGYSPIAYRLYDRIVTEEPEDNSDN